MLQQEDYKSLIKAVMPDLKDFKIKSLGPTEFSVSGMVEVDFLVHINSKKYGEFLLHIEFESFYKSNIEMMARMANYYNHIRSYSNLPIYQVLVVLNKSKSVKKIESSFCFEELGLKRKFEYKVIEIYKMNKEEILKSKNYSLYPFRVFMKSKDETDKEHIQECLRVTKKLKNKNYYFFTAMWLDKKYYKSEYEKYVKEEILMLSEMYQMPFNKGILRGKEKGIEKGIEKGKVESSIDTTLKLLTKKFGPLPKEIREKINKTNLTNLENIIDNIFDYESLDDVKLS